MVVVLQQEDVRSVCVTTGPERTTDVSVWPHFYCRHGVHILLIL